MPDPQTLQAPPADLDVLAARQAVQVYRSAAARGFLKIEAWEQAVETFGAAHPDWPLPLAQREAARTLGPMVLNLRAAEQAEAPPVPACRPPLDLLVDLATPETAQTMRAAAQAGRAPARLPWTLACPTRPSAWRAPLRPGMGIRPSSLPGSQPDTRSSSWGFSPA
ncbi:hypothetical protein J8J14_11150 [Roseomonas sp. SSH11]|uniref:Uncharacterized protein n=1 Tax=Pararoseomonas baculiformis TaxID=2820812 RepID=A0ABS4AEC9_9PROT|nr:hypothetical protein [Pararoseomonas baculiformis]MBP0445336.1 hypothetical protein [Pararoseomonas baculiformis]